MGVRADPGSLRCGLALSRQRPTFATATAEAAAEAAASATPSQHHRPASSSSSSSTSSSRQPAASTEIKIIVKLPPSRTTSTSSCRTAATTPCFWAGRSAAGQLVLLFAIVCTALVGCVRADSAATSAAAAAAAASSNALLPGQQDAIHITAILGDSVVFNCHVEFPGDHPVPYVLQWEKKVSETGQEVPIYIWYENYPTHSGEGYVGRVSRVAADSPYGAASLNLTGIQESDQGWYECKVVFLNRSPNQHKNGSWFHLDVHAPPRFSVTPDTVVYVNLGDSIILNCQADGTPTPEILWYKDGAPVDISTSTVGVFNDGTELRISTIRDEDIGEYTCNARNGEGHVSHTARVIIAGGAVIMVPPTNQTKLEGEKAVFTCEAKAMPGNVTVRWFREGAPVRDVAVLDTRVTIRKDGSLIINPVSADDSGQYLCEVSNGIGDPQSAAAHLNVEYPAKVSFTPTVQYLPFRLAGVVQCYIKSNPPLQYVTWTKDKHLLEPYQTKDIVIMNNGSLLFTRVNQDHQGRYTCTPYNAQGTQGSSGAMEVLVRKPPAFVIEPEPMYQRKTGESVEMHCDAQEAEGTQRPNIQWQRRDGMPLQRNRVKANGGNITIDNLVRGDFGYYQCVASNEVATIVSATQLVIEGTQPHAPYNVSGQATESTVTMTWMPGYSGGPDYKQDYTLHYREGGVSDWQPIPVTPSGSTQVTINKLSPGTTYEFQVAGKNVLGDGMMSKVVTIRTLDVTKPKFVPTSSVVPPVNDNTFQEASDDLGPKPGQPRNLTVTEISNGFLITWEQPIERMQLVQFYTIKYRTDSTWKTLNRGQIRPEETSYLVKNLVGGRTYYFRVLANSAKTYESSDEVKFPVPARVKHKAITAGVVGGILFFIVAIILSICAVKICNKRKRRKQEKAYNMVACRTTDVRYASTRGGRSPATAAAVAGLATQTRHDNDDAAGFHPNGQAHLAPSNGGQYHHHHHHPGGGVGVSAFALQQQQHQQQQQQHHQQQSMSKAATTPASHLRSVTGSVSSGQVPLKTYRTSRFPGLNILVAILRWIWPADRCTNCHSIYSISKGGGDFYHSSSHSVTQIHRAADGRFVDDATAAAAAAAELLQQQTPATRASLSSSDDGGFLSKQTWAAWRLRQLMQRNATNSVAESHQPHISNHPDIGLGFDTVDSGHATAEAQHFSVPVDVHQRRTPARHHTAAAPQFHTPSRVSRIVSSSPATSSGLDGTGATAPWSPINTMYFSDLSSVLQPPHTSTGGSFALGELSSHGTGTAHGSFPVSSGMHQLRYLQERYSQELPSLRAIHEETRRMAQGFVPLHVQLQPTTTGTGTAAASAATMWRHSQPMNTSIGVHHGRHHGRSRLMPRCARMARSAPDLGSPGSQQQHHAYFVQQHNHPQYNLHDAHQHHHHHHQQQLINLGLLDTSPESRSSSSGFGSKNTSTQHNQSSQSGSTSTHAQWRYLPPYRPPPAPPVLYQNVAFLRQQQQQQQQQLKTIGYLNPQPQSLPELVRRNSDLGTSASVDDLDHHHYLQYEEQLQQQLHEQQLQQQHVSMSHWLDLIARMNPATTESGAAAAHSSQHQHNPQQHQAQVRGPESVDVGSVDGHYEFDQVTLTPTASTPTGLRDDLLTNMLGEPAQHFGAMQYHSLPTMLTTPAAAATTTTFTGNTMTTMGAKKPGGARLTSRYEHIEARVQAMKEEFYAYRKRQAAGMAGGELESAC